MMKKQISRPISVPPDNDGRIWRIIFRRAVPVVRICDTSPGMPSASSMGSSLGRPPGATDDVLERRTNAVGRAATASVPRITVGGLRLAVLDLEQTANFMLDVVFPRRCANRPLYLTSANGEVLARCSTDP